MAIPTPWTVGVQRFQSAGEDAHGNPTVTYATAIDLPVHFVAPAESVEPFRANRDLLSTDLAVGCPSSDNLPGPRDLVTWEGEDYTVEGDVKDYTIGPWVHPDAGVTFVIRRVEG